MKDLAPTIFRQRAVIEGVPKQAISAESIKQYLSELSEVTEMRALMEPITHRSTLYGEAGWIHWEASGAHFYAWEQPILFFSVDVYTCKAFDVKKAADFTKKYFNCQQLVYKEF